jgi:N-acetylglucosaminyldiphosphoundecaprenol N-acetyl-beta-D-mannosaminyltransferase
LLSNEKQIAVKASIHATAVQANVLGVGVHAVDMELAASMLSVAIDEGRRGYVCLAGVHGIMEAYRDPTIRSIFANALLVAPDGMPTVWMGHLQGLSNMRRVFGPDLMAEVMRRDEFRHCTHFLCGGEPGVAEKLRDEMLCRFPHLQIVGIYTPPFRQMTAIEEKELVDRVHVLQPDIFWVGLSTPKQDRFMSRYLPILDTKLMIGVGAAFLYHTGAIKDSPRWVKQAGLQWLHRLIQEPARLWKRYLINVPSFLFHIGLQLTGFKHFFLEETRQCNGDSVRCDLQK